MKEAITHKSTLFTIGLDIANAYGVIPHKLIIFALQRYGITPQWIRLVENYYKGIFSKSLSDSAISGSHRHQLGDICRVHSFFILFLAGMNIILEYSLQVKVSEFTTNNIKLPLLYAFIDDLSLMSCAVSGAQTLLSQCITALTWACVEFRADKSYSIVIIKGRCRNTTHFFMFQKQ